MQYAIIFITTSTKKEAERISNILLDKHVIACSNIIKGIDSRFWWKGKKEKSSECLIIAKTLRSRLKKLIKLVRSVHSYDVPEMIALPIIAGHKPYLDWIKSEVST